MSEPSRQSSDLGIWGWAFGYFAAYAPYSLLTKAISDGKLGAPISGLAILPLATFASLLTMVAFLTTTGWHRAASRGTLLGREVPMPTRFTALSGLCGATILTTTTLAYTFEGVSIVFMMLLMRGGLLVMAPLVDLLSGRKVQPRSWVALSLCLASLVVASYGRVDLRVSAIALVDVAIYLAAYFVRLRFMSKLAKSDAADVTRRYFVEEQLVSTPAAMFVLCALALFSGNGVSDQLRRGFAEVPLGPSWFWVAIIGVLSQGTGIFGAMVLLDRRENSFSVPVNRASSVLAGVVATFGLTWFLGGKPLDSQEGQGALLVVIAIVILSMPKKSK